MDGESIVEELYLPKTKFTIKKKNAQNKIAVVDEKCTSAFQYKS